MIKVNTWYKQLFNSKTYKLSLSAGCTCPTRDGFISTGGCTFCNASGSGDFIPLNEENSIKNQVKLAKEILRSKLKNQNVKYIAYFQNFTNTYGNLSVLEKMWEEALSCEDVAGLALGTRPDCLSSECLEYLGRLAERTFVQVELGFQTANETTASAVNRGYKNSVYFDAVKKLHAANSKIHVVTHIIFGLPGDSKEDMMTSVRKVVEAGTDGIKITCLYVLENTKISEDYKAGKFKVLEMDEYFELLENAVKLIPQSVVVHRLTGDPPKKQLIAPLWTTDKKRVLNNLKKLFGE